MVIDEHDEVMISTRVLGALDTSWWCLSWDIRLARERKENIEMVLWVFISRLWPTLIYSECPEGMTFRLVGSGIESSGENKTWKEGC